MRYFIALLMAGSLFADTGVDVEHLKKVKEGDTYKPIGPWLTGPIVTTSAYTIPKGHFNIEPYAYVMNDRGHYNHGGHLIRHHTGPEGTNFVFISQCGLTDWIDLNIYPQFTYSYGNRARSDLAMGDLIIGPSFQIIRDSKKYGGLTWKWGLNQLFPSGRFQNLSPVYSGNDGLGIGAWSTTVYTAVSKLFHIYRENFLATRSALGVIFNVPVKVHGRNAYGGDDTTIGTITKGTTINWDIGLELTLALNWALALDIENQITTPSKFVGTTNEKVGNPTTSYNISFAPALEYNYSKELGIIAGVWVTAYGVNMDGFLNFVVAVNWYK